MAFVHRAGCPYAWQEQCLAVTSRSGEQPGVQRPTSTFASSRDAMG